MGHNPCFSRIAFAIKYEKRQFKDNISHNPCFSRIAFAIMILKSRESGGEVSQSLF